MAFYNSARIGCDTSVLDQSSLQSVASCNYMTQNYFATDCTMKKPIQVATSQPGIMYNGGGSNSCNIDVSSDLLMSRQQRMQCRSELPHRPFSTMPYLGKGTVNPVVELSLRKGEQYAHDKLKPDVNYSYVPLIPEMTDLNKDYNNSMKYQYNNGVSTRR